MDLLIKDLGVDPEDIIMLVVAWKFHSKTLGSFTKQEFIDGMTRLRYLYSSLKNNNNDNNINTNNY